jgi:hypothetical protein
VADKTDRLLDQLDQLKSRFAAHDAAIVEKLLLKLKSKKFRDAESLISFHEILLFLRAYPRNARVANLAEAVLQTFAELLESLIEAGVDVSELSHPEVSGIAGTNVTDTFTFKIVRRLLMLYRSQVALDWNWFEDENRLAATLPRFMPLLEEDAFVEANVPYVGWLRAARDGRRELDWIVQQFERLQMSEKEKAELYDSLQLYVRWTPSYHTSRTGMRLPVRKLFYHRGPLLQRKDVDLRSEIEKPPPPLQRLSPTQGLRILDMARDSSTVRYRELYGFTRGDEKRVYKAELGRGVDLFLMGVLPAERLPMRAYHSALIFKNGVAVGYFEGLSLFERMESGFNFYYTFREGETAWIYARVLNVLRHLLNVSAFSIDPYQIGYENEEGIESGAFWFYRKLGFRPTRRDLLRMAENEAEKIASKRTYRTPASKLRELAAGPMIFELETSMVGDWDRFSVRTVGLKVQEQMASRYHGDQTRMRERTMRIVRDKLGFSTRSWNEVQMRAFSDFAVVLNLVRDLHDWSREEKRRVIQIILAKAGAEEARYLKLMQRHRRLRAVIIELGS